MMVSFRETFFPTQKEIEKKGKQIEGLTKELLAHRDKEIKLVKNEGVLFCSKPFTSFIGDCESCSYYNDPNRGFVTGGHCALHNVACGYGFICKDNDSDANVEWKEFKNIQR